MGGRAVTLSGLTAQWRWSLRPAALSALAAVIAWWLASFLTGDPRPVFAGATAIVALAPGVANPRLQIVGFVIGIATGLVVGEAARLLAADQPTLVIGPVAFIAIVAASSFGRNPLTLIQAGASGLLVVGSVVSGVGRVQFVDALVGAGVAIAFSQIFFAPDPVPLLERAARNLVDVADTLLASPHRRRLDWKRVEAATVELDRSLGVAHGVSRWTLRGRLNAAAISAAVRRWEIPSRRLAAAASLACLGDYDEGGLSALRAVHAEMREMLGEEAKPRPV